MIYALDSNIISYMLKDNDAVYLQYYAALRRNCHCVLPLIVYYEVLRGLKANNSTSKLSSFNELCESIDILEFTVADADKASEIYVVRKKLGKPMFDNDLLIAAQAITRNYTLVTHNVKHFDEIEGLLIEDWTI